MSGKKLPLSIYSQLEYFSEWNWRINIYVCNRCCNAHTLETSLLLAPLLLDGNFGCEPDYGRLVHYFRTTYLKLMATQRFQTPIWEFAMGVHLLDANLGCGPIMED